MIPPIFKCTIRCCPMVIYQPYFLKIIFSHVLFGKSLCKYYLSCILSIILCGALWPPYFDHVCQKVHTHIHTLTKSADILMDFSFKLCSPQSLTCIHTQTCWNTHIPIPLCLYPGSYTHLWL